MQERGKVISSLLAVPEFVMSFRKHCQMIDRHFFFLGASNISKSWLCSLTAPSRMHWPTIISFPMLVDFALIKCNEWNQQQKKQYCKAVTRDNMITLIPYFRPEFWSLIPRSFEILILDPKISRNFDPWTIPYRSHITILILCQYHYLSIKLRSDTVNVKIV